MDSVEERIEFIAGAWCWVLKHDTGITPHVKSKGRLDWDDEMNSLPCWLSVGPGDWCLDIGAYIGDSAVPMLKRGASVIAAECQPDAFECLTRNVPCVEAHRVACGHGESYSLRHQVGGNTGARALERGSDHVTVTVDSLVADRRIKLAKIDVEGFECNVLRGMAETISKSRPIVVIERNDSGLREQGGSFDEMRQLLPGYEWTEWRHSESELWDYVATPIP